MSPEPAMPTQQMPEDIPLTSQETYERVHIDPTATTRSKQGAAEFDDTDQDSPSA